MAYPSWIVLVGVETISSFPSLTTSHAQRCPKRPILQLRFSLKGLETAEGGFDVVGEFAPRAPLLWGQSASRTWNDWHGRRHYWHRAFDVWRHRVQFRRAPHRFVFQVGLPASALIDVATLSA